MRLKIAAALAVLAVFAGVIYVARETGPEAPAPRAPSAQQAAPAPPAPPLQTTTRSMANAGATTRPAASDPRLAALMVSADNGLIDFRKGPNGKVIQEIDNDPSSLGYRKPLREYTYRGDQVVGLIAYQYFSDHVQISRTMVSYKPDGSVDKFDESTAYEETKKGNRAN